MGRVRASIGRLCISVAWDSQPQIVAVVVVVVIVVVVGQLGCRVLGRGRVRWLTVVGGGAAVVVWFRGILLLGLWVKMIDVVIVGGGVSRFGLLWCQPSQMGERGGR